MVVQRKPERNTTSSFTYQFDWCRVLHNRMSWPRQHNILCRGRGRAALLRILKIMKRKAIQQARATCCCILNFCQESLQCKISECITQLCSEAPLYKWHVQRSDGCTADLMRLSISSQSRKGHKHSESNALSSWADAAWSLWALPDK